MDKVSFSGSKISLISRFEWIISARAGCCKRKLLRLLSKKTLHSGIELISEFPKEWLIITKILFCRVSYCFCLFGEFAKVFERQVRVAHLHSAQRVHFQVRVGVFMDDKETGLETCWRDRRNLVEICDVTKIVFWSVSHYSSRDSSAKVIVRKFSLFLCKSQCLHMLWTSACCLRAPNRT